MNTEAVDEYIVVLEYQPRPSGETVGYGNLHALVEEVREWHPTALFSPERYALQVHVVAHRAVEALRRGLDIHDRAVTRLGLRAPALARVEILTTREFDSQWEVGELGSASPGGTSFLLSDELYWATRALLRAASASELSDIMVHFVTTAGGHIQRDSSGTSPGQVTLDMSLEDDETLFAVVDHVSVSGLILEESLPPLVADARAVLERRRQRLPRPDELELPPANQWRCSGAGG